MSPFTLALTLTPTITLISSKFVDVDKFAIEIFFVFNKVDVSQQNVWDEMNGDEVILGQIERGRSERDEINVGLNEWEEMNGDEVILGQNERGRSERDEMNVGRNERGRNEWDEMNGDEMNGDEMNVGRNERGRKVGDEMNSHHYNLLLYIHISYNT
jgi:hypothetical protein